MMNPLKLTVVTLVCASVMAGAPYTVKILLPQSSEKASSGAAAQAAKYDNPSGDASQALLSPKKKSTKSSSSDSKEEKSSDKSSKEEKSSKKQSSSAKKSSESSSKKDEESSSKKEQTASEKSEETASKKSEETASKKSESSEAQKKLPEPKVALPAEPTKTPKPEIPVREEVKRAQQMLGKLGTSGGTADGKLGPRTESAIRDFQKSHGISPSGQPDEATLAKLEQAVSEKDAKAKAPAEKDAAKEKSAAAKETPKPQATAAAAAKTPAPTPAVPQPVALVRKDGAMPSADPGPVPSMQKMPGVRKVQSMLTTIGVYNGPVDGKWGKQTSDALADFQKNNGMKPDRKVGKDTWNKLHEASLAAWKKNSGEAAPAAHEAAKATPAPAPAKEETKPAVAEAKPTAKPADDKKTEVAAEENKTSEPAKSAASQTPESKDKPAVAKATAVPPEKLEISKPASTPSESTPKAALPAPAEPKIETTTVAEIQAAAPADNASKQPPSLNPEGEANPLSVKPDQVVKVRVDSNQHEQSKIATPSTVTKPAEKAEGAAKSETAQATPAKPAAGDQSKQPVIEKEIQAAQARIAIASNASASAPARGAADAKKATPESKPEPAATQTPSAPPATASITPASADAKLAPPETQARKDALKKTAERKVAEVEQVYKAVKSRYAQEVVKEPLADTMAKIDSGFEAMKGDLKKGNFEPILELADGFKLAIEMLANDAAKLYVDTQMSQKSVKSKLSKSTSEEIEQLCSKKKYTEAADRIEGAVKEKPKSSSSSKRSKRKKG